MTFCQLSFSEGILYSNRAAGSSETLVGVSNGRNNFYSVGPQPTEERMFSSFRIGLFLAQTLSMIQNLNKTLGLEHGSKNFINASAIDTLTAVKPAANVAQVLQIILCFFQR